MQFLTVTARRGREASELGSRSCPTFLPILVEASSGSGFGIFVAFRFAFADLFGVAARLVVAGFFLAGGEDALLGAGEALVGVHAFQQELGGGDGDLGAGLGVDLQGRELFHQALNLLQLGEGAG